MTWEADFDVFFRLRQAAESMSFLRWAETGSNSYVIPAKAETGSRKHVIPTLAETGPNSYVIPAGVGGQRLGIYSCWGRHSWLLPSLTRLP